jgi:hypothetical protein
MSASETNLPQADRLAGLDGALCLLRHWTVCLDVPSPAATSSSRRSTTDNATSANLASRPTTPPETSPIKKAEHGHCQASPGHVKHHPEQDISDAEGPLALLNTPVLNQGGPLRGPRAGRAALARRSRRARGEPGRQGRHEVTGEALLIQPAIPCRRATVSTARVPTRARPVSVGLQPRRVMQRWSVLLDPPERPPRLAAYRVTTLISASS